MTAQQGHQGYGGGRCAATKAVGWRRWRSGGWVFVCECVWGGWGDTANKQRAEVQKRAKDGEETCEPLSVVSLLSLSPLIPPLPTPSTLSPPIFLQL
jgi:hypothetical protein